MVRENAESTKMQIVYDASAQAKPSALSLNDCLNAGPLLQNKLWDVLVRQWSYPIAVAGDLKKAFLQVRIKEADTAMRSDFTGRRMTFLRSKY